MRTLARRPDNPAETLRIIERHALSDGPRRASYSSKPSGSPRGHASAQGLFKKASLHNARRLSPRSEGPDPQDDPSTRKARPTYGPSRKVHGQSAGDRARSETCVPKQREERRPIRAAACYYPRRATTPATNAARTTPPTLRKTGWVWQPPGSMRVRVTITRLVDHA